jgi:hypothetical protein
VCSARRLFVVARDHRSLYDYLRERFAGDEGVDVILDRRVRKCYQSPARHEPERSGSERRARAELDAQQLRVRGFVLTIFP